jgi:hypothetical protein
MIEFVTVVALILTGFALVWLSRYARLGLGEASKTTVILAPLILFLFLSGKISELEGLGWKAKFSNVRTQDVIKAARSSDLATISEQTDPGDFRNEANWGLCRPYYLLTESSAKNKAKPDELDQQAVLHIAAAIRSSIVCGRFWHLSSSTMIGSRLAFFLAINFWSCFASCWSATAVFRSTGTLSSANRRF